MTPQRKECLMGSQGEVGDGSLVRTLIELPLYPSGSGLMLLLETQTAEFRPAGAASGGRVSVQEQEEPRSQNSSAAEWLVSGGTRVIYRGDPCGLASCMGRGWTPW